MVNAQEKTISSQQPEEFTICSICAKLISWWKEEKKIIAQGWLDENYSQKERKNFKELYINKNMKGELDLSGFTNLEKIYISYFVDENELEIKDKTKYKKKIIKLVKAQEWLESQEEYNTKQKREKVEKLNIREKNLESHLNLKNFINLVKLDCSRNQLTSLKINNCLKLKELQCGFNKLTELDLSGLEELETIDCNDNYLTNFDYSVLNSDKLISLNISDNNLPEQDCEVFSQFTNLELLWIGSENKEYFQQNIYNKFSGSLETLQNCTKLKNLLLTNTDIAGELELLPPTVKKIYCSTKERPDCAVKNLEQQLNNSVDFVLVDEETGQYTKKEQVQAWLNVNYPPEKRIEVEKLDISNSSLTGSLTLQGFVNLKKLWCKGQNLTSLDVGTCSNLEELQCHQNKLTNLNLTNCSQLKEIYCYENQLTNLTLPTKLANLEVLVARDNYLTKLDFTSFNGQKLTTLSLQSNNFSTQDLTSLTKFTQLKELWLGNTNQEKINQGIYNRWTGSLQSLQNMSQLHTLDIANNDIASGREYLPSSIMQINCSYFLRPNSQTKLLVTSLDKSNNFILTDSIAKTYLGKKLNPAIFNQIKDFNHQNLTPKQETLLMNLIPNRRWRKWYKDNGLCLDCQQLNGDSEWCQPCVTPYLQKNFANWTSGNPELDKVIQECQLTAKSWNDVLHWIPYEEFTDTEYLSEGGFSKVYKAKRINESIGNLNIKKSKWERDGKREVALKVLHNSQNMTTEFLQEIINTKSVDGGFGGSVVTCNGISQDPVTKNYLMVMHYMPDGNLRQYLSKNYDKLSFQDKFFQLLTITQSLHSIHQADLVHRDFHVGNVLNLLQNNHVFSFISDLGLSRPANELSNGTIYGVIPYVAPEVLRDKKYTPAADIYSWGMIAYELLTNEYPYSEIDNLGLRVFQGLRPDIDKVPIPQLLKDLIKRCWNAQPEQRPTADELWSILRACLDGDLSLKKDTELYQQYQEIEQEYNHFSQNTPYQIHASAITTSQPIDTKEIARLFQESEEQVLELELKKIEQVINQLLTDEQKELVKEFIQIRKEMIKNEDNKELKSKALELEDQLLDEKGLSEESIEKIIDYCKRLNAEQEKLQTQVEIPTNK